MLPPALFALVLSFSALVAAGPIPELSPDNHTSNLETRSVWCKKTSECSGIYQAPNSHYYCNPLSNQCQYNCNSGYTKSPWHSNCVKDKGTSYWKPEVKVAASTSSYSDSMSGVSAFQASGHGWNTGAIASWFKTNSPEDNTNGHSWCWYPYSDSTPGFAPSLSTMLNAAGGDETAAREMWCGREAVVKTSDGKTVTLYITDAFDDTWVRTPNSIDVVYGSFPALYGSQTNNKDDVVHDVSWKLTGNLNEQYKYNGAGSS